MRSESELAWLMREDALSVTKRHRREHKRSEAFIEMDGEVLSPHQIFEPRRKTDL